MADDVEAYLAKLGPKERAALERVRALVLEAVPGAVERMSYGMPAVKLDGKGVAGYAAFKGHLSYFPMSSNVVPLLAAELEGFTTSKGTIQFTLDKPLPAALVRKLVKARLAELQAGKGR